MEENNGKGKIMLKIDEKIGTVEFKGRNSDLPVEIMMALKFFNDTLDEQPPFIKDSLEEAVVFDDEIYSEICKFALRMNNAKSRLNNMKERCPELFKEDGTPNEEYIDKMIPDFIRKIADILDKK